MGWASERCKPQHISASLCFFAQRSAWRCLALSLSATQNFTIVRRSRSNRHLNSFRRCMSRKGATFTPCFAEFRSSSHCNAHHPNTPPRDSSPFVAPPSFQVHDQNLASCLPALRGESRQLTDAANSCFSDPCIALQCAPSPSFWVHD